jgi:hypothetical protein
MYLIQLNPRKYFRGLSSLSPEANFDGVKGVPRVQVDLRVPQAVGVLGEEDNVPTLVGQNHSHGVTILRAQLRQFLDGCRPLGNLSGLAALEDRDRGTNRNLLGGVHVLTTAEGWKIFPQKLDPTRVRHGEPLFVVVTENRNSRVPNPRGLLLREVELLSDASRTASLTFNHLQELLDRVVEKGFEVLSTNQVCKPDVL